MTSGAVLALVFTVFIVPITIAAVTWVEARLPETRQVAGIQVAGIEPRISPAGPENGTHHGWRSEASAAGLCPEPRPKVWVIEVLQFSDKPVDAHQVA